MSHALRLLEAKQFDPSPRMIAWAERRVFAAGRLAELGIHLVPGVLAVRVLEHGGVDKMSVGSLFAEVWLDARDLPEWRTRAEQLLQREAYAAKGHGLRLTLAIHRATRWDRRAESLAWGWHRLTGALLSRRERHDQKAGHSVG